MSTSTKRNAVRHIITARLLPISAFAVLTICPFLVACRSAQALDDLAPSESPTGAQTGHAQNELPKGAVLRIGSFLFRHQGERIRSLSFSPDEKELASVGEDGMLRVWDLETLRERFAIKQSDQPTTAIPTCVQYSPDGKQIASSSHISRPGPFIARPSITLWDSTTGRPRIVIPLDDDGALQVCFSPDGALIASAGHSRRRRFTSDVVKLWNTATGRLVKTLEVPGQGVHSIAFSPDGKLLAAGSFYQLRGNRTGLLFTLNFTVRIWNLNTGAELKRLDIEFETATLFAFQPDPRFPLACLLEFNRDGSKLWVSSHEGTTRLVDMATTKVVRQRTWRQKERAYDSEGFFSRLTPDGSLLVLNLGQCLLWDGGDESTEIALSGAPFYTRTAAVSSRGRYLAVVGTHDSTVKVWDLEKRTPLTDFEAALGAVAAVALSPDGESLATAEGGKPIKIWSARTGKRRQQFGSFVGTPAGGLLRYDQTGKRLFASEALDRVALFDGASGDAILSFQAGDARAIPSYAISADETRLASIHNLPGAKSTTVDLFSASTGRKLNSLQLPLSIGIALNHDGTRLATFDIGREVCVVYDTASKREINALTTPAVDMGRSSAYEEIRLQFSKDGKYLAAGKARNIYIWDAKSGRHSQSISSSPAAVFQFSGDSQVLVTCQGATLSLWRTGDWKLLGEFSGQERRVIAIGIDSAGKRCASTSLDGTIVIWNLEDLRTTDDAR